MTPCRLCGGAAHPATGCAYTPTFLVCWACTAGALPVDRAVDAPGRQKREAAPPAAARLAGAGRFWDYF